MRRTNMMLPLPFRSGSDFYYYAGAGAGAVQFSIARRVTHRATRGGEGGSGSISRERDSQPPREHFRAIGS